MSELQFIAQYEVEENKQNVEQNDYYTYDCHCSHRRE